MRKIKAPRTYDFRNWSTDSKLPDKCFIRKESFFFFYYIDGSKINFFERRKRKINEQNQLLINVVNYPANETDINSASKHNLRTFVFIWVNFIRVKLEF